MLALLAAVTLAAAPHRLRHDTARDVAITSAAAATWATEALLKSALGPHTCHWCDRSASGADTLNGLDRSGEGLVWAHPGTADTLSTALVIAIPVGVVGADAWMAHVEGADRDILQDALSVTQAVVLEGAVGQGVKYLAARQRPYAHRRGESGPSPVDDNLSFYSGHTSFAFVVATAAGTVASLRGYREAWAVWAAGIAGAGAVGYFRVAAERHYVTDVLAGAAVGAVFGIGVPLLLHGRGGERVEIVPGPGGVSVVGIF